MAIPRNGSPALGSWTETGEWRDPAVGRMRNVPTLTINDPEIYRMTRYLAGRRRTSLTEAVREALRDAVAREQEAAAAPLAEPAPVAETRSRSRFGWLR